MCRLIDNKQNIKYDGEKQSRDGGLVGGRFSLLNMEIREVSLIKRHLHRDLQEGALQIPEGGAIGVERKARRQSP